MKSQDRYKTIQLIILLAITVSAGIIIFANKAVFHAVATDPATTILTVLLWATLLVSFVFIYIDFRYFLTYKREYKEMDYSLHSDPLTGISNRFSCDMLIEQYLDEPLPEDMGCITFVIKNMQEINKKFGHKAGNTLIRDFSMILHTSASGVCFVGRNGGNNFLAIFEHNTEADMDSYLHVLEQKIQSHNQNENVFPIEYAYGKAYHENKEEVPTITDLIALSNKRIVR